jgi:cytochrome c peroxidase
LAVATASPPAAADATFSPAERAAILRHGPWPVKTRLDPSNRMSGNPAAIRFGRRLFFSQAIARDRQGSCAACHRPDRAFTDGLAVGQGRAAVDRNTMALFNLRLNRWFGWAGQTDSLWAQSIRPILDRRELAMTPALLQRRIAGDKGLSHGYRQVFGALPGGHTPQQVLVNVAKALAAFQETLVTGRTPFDRFRDALAKNNTAAIAAYPVAAKRGLRLFVGRGQCAVCHFGPNFTNGEFHNIGVLHFIGPDNKRVDPGRYGGIRNLRKIPFSLLGKWNDDPKRSTAGFTRRVTLHPRNWGEFRVPSLRQVALTAPYMHNGSMKTLEAVVRHYSKIPEDRLHQGRGRLLKPLNLSEQEIADLVAFLKTLTAD